MKIENIDIWWKQFKPKLRIYLILGAISFILLLMAFRILIFQVTFQDKSANVVYSLAFALIYGEYLVSIGLRFGVKKNWQKLMIFLLFAIFSAIGQIGIKIIINVDWLLVRVLATNTSDSIAFFIGNAWLFLGIWFLTFAIEGEKE